MVLWAHPSPQPKRHLHRFSRFCTAHPSVPILYNGIPLSPSKLPLPMVGSGPTSNTWFAGPTRVHNPNGILIGSAVFAGLTSMTHRPTDHTMRSVTIRIIYVRSTAMRPNNNLSQSQKNQPMYTCNLLSHLTIVSAICIQINNLIGG